jgi:predicted nucleotidyltransferase
MMRFVAGSTAMPVELLEDPVLTRFRAALEALYGERLERVVLFGSRARGDARPDSDYDIAVFLRDGVNLLEESRALAELETDVLFDTGAIITTIPFPAGAYARPTPLMQEIRREGRDL